MSEDILNPTAKTPWSEVFRSYMQPKMLAMLFLGFGSGLPFMMFFSKLSRWLSDVGIEKSTIGFFYWIGLAYAFKFVWAPVVDKARIPVLTRLLGQDGLG
jgi:PAT family beta-lactamase induction signal transducer AmpG